MRDSSLTLRNAASINGVLATSQEYIAPPRRPRAQAAGGRKARAYHSTPAFTCANFTENNGMPTPSCRVKGHEIDGGGSARASRTHCRGRTPSGPASSPTGGPSRPVPPGAPSGGGRGRIRGTAKGALLAMLHNRSAGAHKQGGLPLVLRVVGAEHEGRVVGVAAAAHASTRAAGRHTAGHLRKRRAPASGIGGQQ